MHLAIAHNESLRPRDFTVDTVYSEEESAVLDSFPYGDVKERRKCLYVVLSMTAKYPNIRKANVMYYTTTFYGLHLDNVKQAIYHLVGSMEMLSAWRTPRHRFLLVSPGSKERVNSYRQFLLNSYPEFKRLSVEIPALRRN